MAEDIHANQPDVADDTNLPAGVTGNGPDHDEALKGAAPESASAQAEAEQLRELEAAVQHDESGGGNVRNLLTTVTPVGKPGDFFRVHPGEGQSCVLIGLQTKDMDKTFHPVALGMRNYLADYIGRFLIVRCIDMNNEEFLWPIPLPVAGEEANEWTKSMLRAVEKAKTEWAKLVYVRGASGYKIEPAQGKHDEPEWQQQLQPDGTLRERTFAELRTSALVDAIISNKDHRVAIKLREGKRQRRG
jgi:hypothetical protein